MCPRSTTACVLGVVLSSSPTAALGQAQGASDQAESVDLEAIRIPDNLSIDLDGRLDEEAWSLATPISDFTQQYPVEGGVPSERTEIRVVFNGDELFIGAILYDDPSGILAYQKRRDAGLGTDDRFMWILDTFLDGRTGYFFEINAAGLMGDGLITGSGGRGGRGGGGGIQKSWDGIWETRVVRRPDGWSAEIRIPFRTLNFDPNLDSWGINFQRTIRRRQEEILWRGYRRNQGVFQPIHAGRLTGLTERPPERRLGPGGHDQRERYDAVESFDAPDGLGLVEEYVYVSARTRHPLKAPCPGPYTLAGRIVPGRLYADRMAVSQRFAEIINAELRALVEAGVDFIQLDEPSYAVHKHSPKAFVDLFNQTVEGVEARIGLHLCFGNYIGRPVAHRTYAPLFPHILEVDAEEIHMEFANREMAEVELTRPVVEAGKTVAAGLIDVKNYFIETPEIVADRIRRVLAHVPPDRLVVAPDCGLSQTARWAARAKLQAMVEGATIVRGELGGVS